MNWIPGRTPELFIKDDAGNEIEKIDLSQMSTDEIHALVQSKGFTRADPPVAADGGAGDEL